MLLAAPPIADAQVQSSAGPAPAGNSPPPAALAGCVYLPNGLALVGFVGSMGLTCDATGALRVNVVAGGSGSGGSTGASQVTQGTSPWVDNVAQFGGAPVATGTGPGGSGIPRITLSNDSTIANTAFGISGTLPAFAATPTVNLGTIGGAATAANQTNVQSAPGIAASALTGIQGGGSGALPVLVQVQNQVSNQAVSGTVTANQGVAGATAWKVDGSGVTQPVSGAVTANLGSLNGAATAANQTAPLTVPGTTAPQLVGIQGGGANANLVGVSGTVIANQGTASATPWKVDGSAVVQPAAEVGSSAASAGIVPTTITGTALVSKAGQGNLYSVYGLLTAAATAQTYLVTINATTAPTSGASITPVDVAIFPSNAVGATASVDYKAGPPNSYGTGIVHLVTTSLTTYTPGPAAYLLSRVR